MLCRELWTGGSGRQHSSPNNLEIVLKMKGNKLSKFEITRARFLSIQRISVQTSDRTGRLQELRNVALKLQNVFVVKSGTQFGKVLIDIRR